MGKAMRTLGIIAVGLVLLIGGGIVWYALAYPTYTYRYRMTVEVIVDGVVRSGSSVIEVRLNRQPKFLSEVPRVRSEFTGDAVFVDLGRGRNVVALLAAEAGKQTDFPMLVVPAHYKLSYENDDLPKYSRLRGQWTLSPDALPPSQMPTLITFVDINDPFSAKVIYTHEFPKIFGEDVREPVFKITMTDEPVTKGIERRFPWWDGPFQWLRPIGNGAYVDTRVEGFKWTKEMLKRTM
jgi:hypothetical protein